MSKLAEAKQILIDRGRTTRQLENEVTGCVCPLGALNIAYYGSPDAGEYEGEEVYGYDFSVPGEREDVLVLAKAAREKLLLVGGETYETHASYHDVYKYNDGHTGVVRTDEEVLSLFDEAIATIK